MVRLKGLGFAVGFVVAGGLSHAVAQDSTAYPEPERCPRFIASAPTITLAKATIPIQAADKSVSITYVGHSTFLIQSPAGVTIATDYNDGLRPPVTPEIATMNRAHITHFSISPDPDIAYLLPGWGRDGEPAAYDLTVRDVWIRNVTTNIRRDFGGFDDFDDGGMSGVERDMNSMFVFEVAGLCIAHLGHLHHLLTDDHLKALGRIDVVLAPVDGSRTLNVEDMITVLRDIQAPLIIPMHFFGGATLNRFTKKLEEFYAVELSSSPTVSVSRDTLPAIPTLLVLPGA